MTKLLTLAGLCALAFIAACGSRTEGVQHGKTLVAEYKVPAATLLKFESFQPAPRKPGDSVLESTMLADGVEWTGPPVDVDSTANPYKVAVTILARAKEDGDAVTMWKVGWNLGEDGTRYTLMPGLTRSGLKAGQDFTATALSDPISFKKDRPTAVALELVNARNIEISAVDVAVWSGIGGTTFLQKFGAFTYVLIGAVMLGLWWLWFRRPRTDADL